MPSSDGLEGWIYGVIVAAVLLLVASLVAVVIIIVCLHHYSQWPPFGIFIYIVRAYVLLAPGCPALRAKVKRVPSHSVTW